MELYNKTSFSISKIVTKNYSTSFSLGIAAFAPKYRDAIYGIYAFVRLADEIVDTFHVYDQKKLMRDLRRDTEEALRSGISTNPILQAFVQTVHQYKIDYHYIDAFLKSMEMDLSNSYYEKDEYNEYIYGSAEVVGLMCLKVFCGDDKELFEKLIAPAGSLGSAFQKVNFLRDIKSDMEERERIYLPGINHANKINDESKKNLEQEVEKEFHEALEGIKKLPHGVKLGVYSAYLYYVALFRKIQRLKVKELMKESVRVSNPAKIALLFRGLVEVRLLKLT
ncbi:phytoene/squalene synthase family protein [Ignavibacterium sp.]|uniref:phytoene/squalene synthase family protein n=1 Tax=Ignavibacterium sp. TaxID=2651167 RepID=UPI00307F81A1